MKLPADHHRIAATALEILLETPGSKARELAALYSRYGQPSALRSAAVRSLVHLAKDDSVLQDIVVSLVDDTDSSLRFWVWEAVRELKIARAVPMLKARLQRESVGFNGFLHRRLQEIIDALGEPASPGGASVAGSGSGAAAPARDVAALEAQAAELEVRARDLRNRIASLKSGGGTQPAETAPKTPATGTGTSH